jgi:spore maturation protein CgeB
MNILFIGSTQGDRCSLYYFTSFTRLGHTAIPVDPQYFEGKTAVERLHIRIRKGPYTRKVDAVSDRIIDMCRKNPFDIVFVMAENFFSHETIESIRTSVKRPPIFIYHSHDNNFSDGIMKPRDFDWTIRAYDFVFTTKSQNVARYNAIGQPNAIYVPSAYEHTVHRPIPDAESRFASKKINACFIGTYDQSRLKFLNAVGWDKLQVFGSNWRRYPGFLTHRNQIHPNPIYYLEFSDVISHSRCNLGLLREEAQDLHTQRTFEIPACGGMQIAPRNDEILGFFEDKKEIACFSTPEELKDVVQYYLNHESERESIAKRGYERVTRDKHTYLDRAELMIRTATEAKKPHWPGVALGASERRSGNKSL